MEGYADVAICCPVSVPYQRHSPHSPVWFFCEALSRLLGAAGLAKGEIDGLAASSLMHAPDTAVALTRDLGISPRWLEWLPTGGASGIMAMQRAARAVAAGDADVIACIAADSARPDDFARLLANFSHASRAAVNPYGGLGPNAVFAMITRAYMTRFGATRTDFGRLCVSQRRNAMAYEQALFRKPLTLDEYLEARSISEPLGLYDCVPACAGAEAFLVMPVARARTLGLPYAQLLAAGERHNAYPADDIAWRGGWALEAERLYDLAGRGPADVDLLQTYDDYPVISFLQIEDLGFCTKGEAGRFVAEHDLGFASPGLVHNSSGGQLSAGQAGAAGGFLGLVEALRQLTGTAMGNPMAKCQTALVSGYGMVVYDRCLSSAAAMLGGDGL